MRTRATQSCLHAPVRRQIRAPGAPGLSRLVPALVGFAVAIGAGAVKAEPGTDDAPATLCGIVETSAKEAGLPVKFFTGLIWRESAFRTHAISRAGAMGLAQFMPGAASDLSLVDPFDPATAIPASAKLLSEFADKFGNLGLAAAAYNAGPKVLANWLAGKGTMPSETQDYVRAVTGHDVEEWRSSAPSRSVSGAPAETCLALIAKLQVARGAVAPRPRRGSLAVGSLLSGACRPSSIPTGFSYCYAIVGRNRVMVDRASQRVILVR